MAETEDEGWEKVREMVRNAPPPGSKQEAEFKVRVEEARQAPARKPIWPKVLLGLAAAALLIGGLAYFLADQDAGRPSADTAAKKQAEAPAPETPAVVPAATPEPTPPPPDTVTIRQGTAVNVRAGPSVKTSSVGRLNGGTSVERIDERDQWVQVRFTDDGKTVQGWIRKDLLGN